MIELQKKVIEWGNSAGIYVPRRYIGKTALIHIEERPKFSEQFIYGPFISMDCYGYGLLKPSNFAPELKNESELKGYNIINYNGEEIKIMLPEDIIIDLLTKNQNFRLIQGIPIMLRNYHKRIDFKYIYEKLKKDNKEGFLGYLLEITINILKKNNIRLDLIKELKLFTKKIKTKNQKINFLTDEQKQIYYKTKQREKICSTKRDMLMKKWHVAYFPSLKEFNEVFDLYAKN
jgi:hypothetical protein